MRRRYLVAYDIRSDVRLRRIHLICRMFGYPLQYSVFLCDLNKREQLACKSALRDEMLLSHDSVVMIDLGESSGRGAECFEFIGYRPNEPPLSRATHVL